MKNKRICIMLFFCILILTAVSIAVSAEEAGPSHQEHIWEQTVKKATVKADGILQSTCTVCGKTNSETIAKVASIRLLKETAVYNGKKHTPEVIVTDTEGNALHQASDFKVKTNGKCKRIGSYTITVTLTGNYSGSQKLTFKIVPASPSKPKATSSNQKVSLSWQKVPGANSYVIYSASKKNGTYRKLAQTEKSTWTSKKYKPERTIYFKVKAVYTADDVSMESGLSKAVGIKVALPNTVYVTQTGTKFHLSSCESLHNSKIAISLKDAKQRGYTACSRCIG